MRSTGGAPCGGGTGVSVMTTSAEASHSSQRKARPSARFGGPLALSRVHWVRTVLVAEVTYLTWADDGLLCHTVFVGLRDDKPPREVRRERPV